MRTTLTLDDDVAALLERLRDERKTSLKTVVNEALRQGLAQVTATPRKKKRYRTNAVSLGRCRLGTLDNVAEALAAGEGEAFR